MIKVRPFSGLLKHSGRHEAFNQTTMESLKWKGLWEAIWLNLQLNEVNFYGPAILAESAPKYWATYRTVHLSTFIS